MTDQELKELRERTEKRMQERKQEMGEQYLLHPSKPKAKWGIKQ